MHPQSLLIVLNNFYQQPDFTHESNENSQYSSYANIKIVRKNAPQVIRIAYPQ